MLEGRDLMDFSITSWYEKFQLNTLETIIVPLPDEIVRVITSLEFGAIEALTELDSQLLEAETQHIVKAFLENVENALWTLNRKAFLKNNWHAPTDAKVFSMNKLLVVTNIEDLLQYMIASSIIMTDFDVRGASFCLALRPWINIHPATEFRCIVINNTLRGITPRDWPTYYPHYKEEGPEIIDSITQFFYENIEDSFPRTTYTFDVIIEYPSKKILILDFGPLNCKTNLYAFTWKELCPLLEQNLSKEVAPVFRYLESDIGIMTKAAAVHLFQTAYCT